MYSNYLNKSAKNILIMGPRESKEENQTVTDLHVMLVLQNSGAVPQRTLQTAMLRQNMQMKFFSVLFFLVYIYIPRI